MAHSLRQGDTFTAEWAIPEDLGDASAVVLVTRRTMGLLGAQRELVATVTPGETRSVISAVIPNDLPAGEYGVSVRFTRGAEIVTAPSSFTRTLTIWS